MTASSQAGHFLCSFAVLLLIESVTSFDGELKGPNDYCFLEDFNATCSRDHVVIIHRARYGRMTTNSHCVSSTGCIEESDATSLLAGRCSGRQTCLLSVNDELLYQKNPCTKDYQVYLEASYKCVKVLVAKTNVCRRHHELVYHLNSTSNNSAILSPLVSGPVGQAYRNCPWHIRAQPGQTIAITLHSFKPFSVSGTGRNIGANCHQVATIREESSTQILTTCLTDTYRSKGHHVYVTLRQTNAVPDGAFLLELKAVGCPTLKTPHGATQTVGKSSTKIQCNDTGQSWYLTCKDTEWIGKAGNCTGESQTYGHKMNGGSFPYGLLLAVAIGVALGVFCGGMLLTIVAFRNKRRRYQQSRQLEQTYYSAHKPVPCAELRHLNSSESEPGLTSGPDLTGTLHYCPAHHREALLVETPPSDYYMKSSGTRSLTLDKMSTSSAPLTTFGNNTDTIRINR